MLGDENGIVQRITGETIGLTGEFQHNLDAKGRLFIPAKLKESLGSVYFVTVSMDKCLSVYSSDRWERLSERVSAMSYTQQRKVSPVFAVASRCELDAQGRILLPQNLRERPTRCSQHFRRRRKAGRGTARKPAAVRCTFSYRILLFCIYSELSLTAENSL